MFDFQGLYEEGEVIIAEALSSSVEEIKENITNIKLRLDELDADSVVDESRAYDIIQSSVLSAVNDLAYETHSGVMEALSYNPNVAMVELPNIVESAAMDLEQIYTQYVRLSIDNSKKALDASIDRAKEKYRDRRSILAYISKTFFLNVRYRTALANYVDSLESEIDITDKESPTPAYEESEVETLADIYIESAEDSRIQTIAGLASVSTVNMITAASLTGLVANGAIDRIVRKYWVTMDDGAVRNSHLAIPRLNPDGVALDNAFITPLGPLRYPGDTMGTPANVMNCRCVLNYKIGGYDAL